MLLKIKSMYKKENQKTKSNYFVQHMLDIQIDLNLFKLCILLRLLTMFKLGPMQKKRKKNQSSTTTHKML